MNASRKVLNGTYTSNGKIALSDTYIGAEVHNGRFYVAMALLLVSLVVLAAYWMGALDLIGILHSIFG